MCNELGVETGVDLDRLIDVAREAEKIVGHPLPGKVMRGGTPLIRRNARQASAALRCKQRGQRGELRQIPAA